MRPEIRHGFLPLSDLPVGLRGEIISIGVTGAVRRRLLDLGLVPGTKVEAVRKSPVNDPVAFNIRGATIALRRDDVRNIYVKPIS